MATDLRWFYCWKCRMRYQAEKPHVHVNTPKTNQGSMWQMVKEFGSCGCGAYLKKQCEQCKKLLCGKNGPCCFRLSKDGYETPNGKRCLCTDCGIKIRKG